MAGFQTLMRLLSGGMLFFVWHTACIFPALTQSPESTKDAALEHRIIETLRDYEKWKLDVEGKPEAIEGLKKESESLDKQQGSTARVQLAKLGDINEIHSLVCKLYDTNPQAQLDATQALSKVGGYVSIEALARVMLENPPYRRLPPGHYFSLRTYALGALSKLIPELKVPPIASFVPPPDQQFRDWYNWIEEHRGLLGRLQPSDGGGLSEGDCQRLQKENFSLSDVAFIQITTFGSGQQSSINRESYRISNRNGKFCIGTRLINNPALAALVSVATNPLEEPPNLSDLGIDDVWLKANAVPALNGLPPRIQSYNTEAPNGSVLTAEDKQEFLKLFTDMDTVNAMLRGNFFVLDRPENSVNIEIRLRDGETIRLQSEGSSLFLLPWAMHGRAYKEIFDYRLSQAIAKLLPKDAPNAGLLSATGKYGLRKQLALSLAIHITSECSKKECHVM